MRCRPPPLNRLETPASQDSDPLKRPLTDKQKKQNAKSLKRVKQDLQEVAG